MKIGLKEFQAKIVSFLSGLFCYLGMVNTMNNSKLNSKNQIIADTIAFTASMKVENAVNKNLSPDYPVITDTYRSDHARRIKNEKQNYSQVPER